MGPVDSRSESVNADGSPWESEIKIGSPSQVNTVHVVLDPGGTPGWHYHLGPTIITIKSGVGTFYQGDDLTHTPHRVGAGESFVEDGGDVHFLLNESTTTPLEVVFTQIAPVGAPGLVRVPRPNHYPAGFE